MRKELVDLVAFYEGFRPTPYRDLAGYCTIGYGSKCDVPADTVWTEEQARAKLLADLADFQLKVLRLVSVPTSLNQVDALTSFAYNIGIGAFGKSTLLKLLNQRKYNEAAEQFERWNRVKGKVVAGLTVRRRAEKALFLKKEQ